MIVQGEIQNMEIRRGDIVFDFLKKKECCNCGKKTRKVINYAGYDICSESCMLEFFKDITAEELIELDKKDREINADFYRWLNR